MAPKTRQRILDASLAMFNTQGEPNVTTNHIADELEISPGNLYYHFRNKEDIVEHLFARYEARIDLALTVPEDRLPNLEDIWLQLHLAFEVMWDYRFIFRDLVDITSRNRKLRMHYARTLRLWRDGFAARREQVAALGFDERFIRKWTYYLCYCEAAFALRNISVVHTLHTRANNLAL